MRYLQARGLARTEDRHVWGDFGDGEMEEPESIAGLTLAARERLDNLFRQIGIYAPDGQLYDPEDKGAMMFYKEAANGQLLEEGITEAGAISSWTAAGTAYSVHDTDLLPVYIYYSMFGFQRVGDLIWAAADQRTRGFLLGATAGRTTLSGEGLQHQDGSSHMAAAAIPNCRVWDPCFAYELAVIMDHGMARMLDEQRDEFFYITVMNEIYDQPSMPEGAETAILKGLYKLRCVGETGPRVRLVGSGTILVEVLAAAELLQDFGVVAEVFSATSYTELAREAMEVARRNRFKAPDLRETSHVETLLGGEVPVVAASDYVRAFPGQIAPYLRAPMTLLGTDGFGRSANRQALRRFFEVDRQNIALAAIEALVRDGDLPPETLRAAIKAWDIDPETRAPWSC
ncbi:pyruvate dehydrogenase E1 component [Mameliella alba]|uniref:transketolase-like TK C-terminal-containing protein n=1 Tax=Mameliella alba TaxID=561184 RepID=UPI00087EA5DF|nr:pyruvate dehydrogenase E1 component [Mameliella alba]GGF76488.1 hypothetical protein GCM10011319_41120 [Mameliella alba]SDD83650.1 pyruvate dehydrogenase E1 component [Mameliella alba]